MLVLRVDPDEREALFAWAIRSSPLEPATIASWCSSTDHTDWDGDP